MQQRTGILISVMLTIALLACNNQETKPITLQATTPKFKLSLNTAQAASNVNMQLKTKMTNNNTDTIHLSPLYLWHDPVLKLSVWDSTGLRIPTIPPAMPPYPDSPVHTAMVLPTESYEMNYSLHIFSPPLAQGKYTIAMREGTSDTISFVID